ncbi:hypothetical protein, partial [Thalassobaculum sp.]|uniref:hypothetical protein n=1 Tax=Thalassobaculum sp. TaxID=2022740 RepID=UPI0032EB2777
MTTKEEAILIRHSGPDSRRPDGSGSHEATYGIHTFLGGGWVPEPSRIKSETLRNDESGEDLVGFPPDSNPHFVI